MSERQPVSSTIRIALLLEYSGKHFHGSQIQEGVRTVQQELEKALAVIAGRPVRAILSGRTDAGVSARGQIAHVDLPYPNRYLRSDNVGEAEIFDLLWRLNGIAPKDLSIVAMKAVDRSFHARFSACEREYVYRILNRSQRSSLLKDTHFFIKEPLDVKAMSDAALRLLGKHDFSSFRSSACESSSPICAVSRCQLLNLREGELEFWIAADHFVYNMVRIIVGTLIEVGLGKKDADSLTQALDAKVRDLAGPTAPPWGLTLNAVSYPESLQMWDLRAMTIQERRK